MHAALALFPRRRRGKFRGLHDEGGVVCDDAQEPLVSREAFRVCWPAGASRKRGSRSNCNRPVGTTHRRPSPYVGLLPNFARPYNHGMSTQWDHHARLQATGISRRFLLSAGSAACLGLSLPELFRARALQAASQPGSPSRVRSVILLYLHGGHPQHETWDPKPQAPAEVRGEFDSIDTSLPGLQFNELFPHSARIADRLTIVRSLSHDNPNHVQASLGAMTGHSHPPEANGRGDFPPSSADFPAYGAVLDHLGAAEAALPAWVQVGPLMHRANGTVLHGQSPGFLGDHHRPLVVDQDLLPPDVRIEALTPEIGVARLQGRRELLASVDQQRRALDRDVTQSHDHFRARAFEMLSAQSTRQAFDLAAEGSATRERYGPTQFGQCCLLARRLAEAGVPFVNVHFCKSPSGSWDTHGDNFRQMKNSLGPTLDRSLSSLVLDLEERGLLEEVLVLATAEFGRTPQINRSAGRDHWPWVYSIAMAGGPLRRGFVFGASDRLGAHPTVDPRHPRDLAATLYQILGVPLDTTLHDQLGRPHRLVSGEAISELVA